MDSRNIKYTIKYKINYLQYLFKIYKAEIEILKKKLKSLSSRFFIKKKHREIINIIDANILVKNIKKKNTNVIKFIKHINNSSDFFEIYLERYFQMKNIYVNMNMLKLNIIFLKYANIPFHIKINILKYTNINMEYHPNIDNKIKKIKYQLLRI
jgi:hypothetical protein